VQLPLLLHDLDAERRLLEGEEAIKMVLPPPPPPPRTPKSRGFALLQAKKHKMTRQHSVL